MGAQEHRRVANQPDILRAAADRALALAIRRTLLQLVAMIEDHFGLEPINSRRKEARAGQTARTR